MTEINNKYLQVRTFKSERDIVDSMCFWLREVVLDFPYTSEGHRKGKGGRDLDQRRISKKEEVAENEGESIEDSCIMILKKKKKLNTRSWSKQVGYKSSRRESDQQCELKEKPLLDDAAGEYIFIMQHSENQYLLKTEHAIKLRSIFIRFPTEEMRDHQRPKK